MREQAPAPADTESAWAPADQAARATAKVLLYRAILLACSEHALTPNARVLACNLADFSWPEYSDSGEWSGVRWVVSKVEVHSLANRVSVHPRTIGERLIQELGPLLDYLPGAGNRRSRYVFLPLRLDHNRAPRFVADRVPGSWFEPSTTPSTTPPTPADPDGGSPRQRGGGPRASAGGSPRQRVVQPRASAGASYSTSTFPAPPAPPTAAALPPDAARGGSARSPDDTPEKTPEKAGGGGGGELRDQERGEAALLAAGVNNARVRVQLARLPIEVVLHAIERTASDKSEWRGARIVEQLRDGTAARSWETKRARRETNRPVVETPAEPARDERREAEISAAIAAVEALPGGGEAWIRAQLEVLRSIEFEWWTEASEYFKRRGVRILHVDRFRAVLMPRLERRDPWPR